MIDLFPVSGAIVVWGQTRVNEYSKWMGKVVNLSHLLYVKLKM